VIIKADKEVLHGRVVEVMDIAKSAGAVRLAIATEPKAPASRGGAP
jgi:biopolymer transport protein ExbD